MSNFSVTKQRTPVILILTFLRKPYFACSFVHWLQNCFCFPSTTFRIWASQIQYDIKCNRNRGLPTISNPPPPLPLKRLRHLWTAPYPLPLFLIGPPRTLDTWSWPVAIMPTRMIVIMNGCNKSLQKNTLRSFYLLHPMKAQFLLSNHLNIWRWCRTRLTKPQILGVLRWREKNINPRWKWKVQSFGTGRPKKCRKVKQAILGVSRMIYGDVDSPNLGFPYV